MAVLAYRVYYSAPSQYEGAEWFNVFHFDTAQNADSERSRAMCLHLCTATRAFHLPYVTVQRVVVAPYPTAPTTLEDPAPFVFSADRQLESVARVAGMPAPPYTALTLKKQCVLGRSGALWFFHCLKLSDVWNSSHGQFVLHNVAEFEQLVQFWFVGGLAPFDEFRLVVPPSAKTLVQQGAPRPCSLKLGAVAKARTRAKYRALVSGSRVSLADEIGQMAELGNRTAEAVAGWAANGLDFTPPQQRVDIVQLMAGLNAVADKIKRLGEGQAGPDGEQPAKPLKRWGRTFAELVGLAGAVKNIHEKDTASIAEMKTYTFVDRSEYFTHEDTVALQDYADRWANIGAGLCDFDYLTPFSEDSEQSDVTPRDVS
jgi:hypothetical protein